MRASEPAVMVAVSTPSFESLASSPISRATRSFRNFTDSDVLLIETGADKPTRRSATTTAHVQHKPVVLTAGDREGLAVTAASATRPPGDGNALAPLQKMTGRKACSAASHLNTAASATLTSHRRCVMTSSRAGEARSRHQPDQKGLRRSGELKRSIFVTSSSSSVFSIAGSASADRAVFTSSPPSGARKWAWSAPSGPSAAQIQQFIAEGAATRCSGPRRRGLGVSPRSGSAGACSRPTATSLTSRPRGAAQHDIATPRCGDHLPGGLDLSWRSAPSTGRAVATFRIATRRM